MRYVPLPQLNMDNKITKNKKIKRNKKKKEDKKKSYKVIKCLHYISNTNSKVVDLQNQMLVIPRK